MMFRETLTPLNRTLKRSRAAAAVLNIFLLLYICSCSTGPAEVSETGGLSRTYVDGPSSLTQRTARDEISITDILKLVLEASVPENTRVEFPEYSAALGDFTYLNVELAPPRLVGTGSESRIIYEAAYLLKPYLPGTYTIPEMTVAYFPRDKDSGKYSLTTEKIDIVVKSLLAPDEKDFQLKDIKGPLPFPKNTGLRILIVASILILGLAMVGGLLYWLRTSGRRRQPEIRLSPEEMALRELEALLAEDLLIEGEVKLFHLRISDILRRYIENRFGINAPDRTTEEFLTELTSDKSREEPLLNRYRSLLADFLNHCDLVKFAKHEPDAAECEKIVSLCREFIEKTKDEGSRVQGVKDPRGKNI